MVGLSLAGVLVVFGSRASTNSNPAPFQIDGEVVEMHGDDFDDKREVNPRFYLKTSDTQQLRISNGNETLLKSGHYARVTGVVKKDGSLTVNSVKGHRAKATQPAAKKLAVIMYNFSDNKSRPTGRSAVRDQIFTDSESVNKYYQTASLGKISLAGANNPNGDIYGWYTITDNSLGCDLYNWVNQAKKSAAKDGFNEDNYDNVMFMSPDSSCGAGGIGEVSGPYSWVFIHSWDIGYWKQVAIHELGHNFGFLHAHALTCQVGDKIVPISSKCYSSEYGDYFNPMGFGGFDDQQKLFGSFYQNQNGWMADSQVKTVTASGDYTLTSSSLAGTGIKTIRIPRQIDQFNHYEYYYLEYRTTTKFDRFTGKDAGGLMVRLAKPYEGSYGSAESWIISAQSIYSDILVQGNTFTDSKFGITVTPKSKSNGTMKVHLTVTHLPQPDKTAPPNPTNVSVPVKSSKVRFIKWTSVSAKDLAEYRVYRNGVLVGSGFCCDYDLGNDQVGFEDRSKIPPGTSLRYQVKAVDFAGNESSGVAAPGFSSPQPDNVLPSAPSKVTPTLFVQSVVGRPSLASYRVTYTPGSDNSFLYGVQVQTRDYKTNKILYEYNRPYYLGNSFTTSPCSKTKLTLRSYDSSYNYSAASPPVTLNSVSESCGED